MRRVETRSRTASELALELDKRHDGAQLAHGRAERVDALLQEIAQSLAPGDPSALIAVGGYGRAKLSPHSDIDLLIVAPAKKELNRATLRALLYPLWDRGYRVGHATTTPAGVVDRATGDLHALTATLDLRLVAGSETTFSETSERFTAWCAKKAKALAQRVLAAQRERHRDADHVGWTLAPDLKGDIGGLRDVHTVGWLTALGRATDLDAPDELTSLLLDIAAGESLLLAVRDALHEEASRKLDRIHMDLQPSVARRLGYSGNAPASDLMTDVHTCGRTIERSSAAALEILSSLLIGGPQRSGSSRALTNGVRLEDGTIVAREAALGPELALEVAAAIAATGRPAARPLAAALRASLHSGEPARWSDSMRGSFVQVLEGPHSTSALRELDHYGAWNGLLPEWQQVRGLAQHDPYHRYTVDAHSFKAVRALNDVVAEDPVAARAAEEAGDLTALRLATFLHDIGKGSGGDHSVIGETLARTACARMGMPDDTTNEVAALVRHHLLLVDTATRRDLDDGAVVQEVARTVGSARLLRLLYILSVADGRSTGPQGWSDWKRSLVVDLYRKTLVALETGTLPMRSDVSAKADEVESYEPALAGRVEAVLSTLPSSYLSSTGTPEMADEVRLLLSSPGPGEVKWRRDPALDGPGEVVTVCTADRPGALARTAGVLALHRMSVRKAQAYSTTSGLALQRLVIEAPAETSWDNFGNDLSASYAGRLALQPRVEEKARDYRPTTSIEPDVRVLQDASPQATVIEVRATDALGLLYAITSALSDLDLDIEVAKIDTLGARVVDVFYVRTVWGGKLDDAQIPEVKRAIGHRVTRLFN